jgi:BioD-like phosphotransacetylase family protein
MIRLFAATHRKPSASTVIRNVAIGKSPCWTQLRLISTTEKAEEEGEEETERKKPRTIYVAATRQHVGKTTVSLALVSGLQKRYGKVGFIKPVGQQHVPVHSESTGETVRVDKDVVLMREHFELFHIDYKDMSPVIIPQGYTKDFLDGKINLDEQTKAVMQSHAKISDASDVVLCEGTGHVAVGSVVRLNNAAVAKMMDADVVLVANGGLGSAFDELELNRVLCLHHGVRLAGVILNKVKADKYEQTKEYMSRALMQTWGVPLLGCIPDRPFLGCPALADLEALFGTKLISGHSHRLKHYSAEGEIFESM